MGKYQRDNRAWGVLAHGAMCRYWVEIVPSALAL